MEKESERGRGVTVQGPITKTMLDFVGNNLSTFNSLLDWHVTVVPSTMIGRVKYVAVGA